MIFLFQLSPKVGKNQFLSFFGYVTNFAQEGLKGQLLLSVRELSGQGVERFGHSEVLCSLLDHQLPFLDVFPRSARIHDGGL
jgi:hypothetical protein